MRVVLVVFSLAVALVGCGTNSSKSDLSIVHDEHDFDGTVRFDFPEDRRPYFEILEKDNWGTRQLAGRVQSLLGLGPAASGRGVKISLTGVAIRKIPEGDNAGRHEIFIYTNSSRENVETITLKRTYSTAELLRSHAGGVLRLEQEFASLPGVSPSFSAECHLGSVNGGLLLHLRSSTLNIDFFGGGDEAELVSASGKVVGGDDLENGIVFSQSN